VGRGDVDKGEEAPGTGCSVGGSLDQRRRSQGSSGFDLAIAATPAVIGLATSVRRGSDER
jgi:hypothetical protein